MFRCASVLLRSANATGWSSPGAVSGMHRLGPPPQTNPANLRKPGERWSRWAERIAMNSVSEKSSDDKMLGGDHYTAKQDALYQLKMMDRRLQTFKHDDLCANCLKCIISLNAPNGTRVSPTITEGRLVGILIFGDGNKASRFFPTLEEFQKKYKDDFLTIGISMKMDEAQYLLRRHGMYQCEWKNGANMVLRDLGFMLGPFVTLPRLFIVDGTTGFVITKWGYTCVTQNPDECFDEWVAGREGFEWHHIPKTWISLPGGPESL
jgi:hypothetical protein